MDKESEQFKALVNDFVPVNGLPQQYQNEVINQSEVATYKKRQLVFKQGDRDNYSYYLLEGELELLADEQLVKQVSGGTDAARYAMAQLQPRQMSGKAKTAVTILKVDRNLLDRLLTMDDKGDESEVEVSDIDSEESVDWMTRLLQSELFARIPPANIQRIFTTMESVEVNVGDVIVEQGTPGDYYYLIHKGSCEVSRKTASGGEPIKLAELSEGDSFGEEALVSDAVRNASITMTADGELMRLTKEDFVDLIKKPILNAVSYIKAESLVAGGATWLDVRFPEEHQDSGIEGSENIPFNTLRVKLSTLDDSASYVVYSYTGVRSSGAAFLLAQNGIEVSYLSGGLMKSPMAPAASPAPKAPSAAKPAKAPPAPVTTTKKPAEIKKGEAAAPAKKPEKKALPPAEKKVASAPEPISAAEEAALEVDVRVSALDAELAKANFQIEEALKQKGDAELARQRSEKEAKRAVEQERKRLDAQAAKLKQDAEEAKRKLAEAAKGKIQQEREKLEAEAQRLKEEAEAAKEAAEALAEKKIQQEREKLEAKASQANQVLEEAQRLKQELETAKKQADADAERKRAEEEARLETLKKEAQERLRRESEKLEEEYARNVEELGRLKKEREEAEQKLRSERGKMDEQAQEARDKLDEARKLKQETEASRRAVEMEVEEKRQAQEEMERKMREEVNKKIQDERRKLEAEFARQAEEMERMQAEREAAEAARTAAQEEAQRIIAEYKEEHEKTIAEKEEHERNLAEKEEQIRLERERLEQEQEGVKATLEEARRAKEEADNTRQAAERRANELRAAEAEAAAKAATSDEAAAKAATSDEEAQLKAEIAAIEAEMDQAKQQLEEAEQAQQAAAAAQKANEETMSRQKDVEDELLRELADEAVAWTEDFEEKEQEIEKAHNMVLDKEHIERIKRRAADAKRQAEEANADLFGDVANQLD